MSKVNVGSGGNMEVYGKEKSAHTQKGGNGVWTTREMLTRSGGKTVQRGNAPVVTVPT